MLHSPVPTRVLAGGQEGHSGESPCSFPQPRLIAFIGSEGRAAQSDVRADAGSQPGEQQAVSYMKVSPRHITGHGCAIGSREVVSPTISKYAADAINADVARQGAGHTMAADDTVFKVSLDL
jgi:hypothetical protein